MAKIIVAGAGHGGVTAAIRLKKAGFDVTLFEKCSKEDVGLPQSDAFSGDTFKYVDLPEAPYFKRGKNILTFVPEKKELPPFTLPEPEESSFIVDRKELILYLLSLAENEGVNVVYEKEVTEPIMLGSRVCGVVANGENHYCDLVIDSLGALSPLRTALPKYLNVDREIKPFDILYTYRGYFNINNDAPHPRNNYTIYVRDNGTVGFTWLITEIDRVDALISRFYKPSRDEILSLLQKISEENPQMGKELIYGGKESVIPVCQPLAVLVCDGYASVGDSAFMTYPTKGSGISFSMKAGFLLAKVVIEDINEAFDRKSLWEYQKEYFKQFGFDCCRIALFKNLLPYITSEEINELFESGIFNTQELQKLNHEGLSALLSPKGITTFRDKLKILRSNENMKEHLKDLSLWLTKFKVIEATFPSKYDDEDVTKWAERYNEFFDSIRYSEGLTTKFKKDVAQSEN